MRKIGGSHREHLFGTLDLSFDNRNLLADSRIGGFGKCSEAPHAHFDIAQRLSQIVNQTGKRGFSRIEAGHGVKGTSQV